ncbi:MAG: response regulator [Blautia sp.]|nr:response regulator [Blautia sp.]MCM1201431.1 response regulator [Bacteroides fragilis]
MKYKVLITGKNTAVIDDFFVQMEEHFEAISTSARYEDIVRHIRYFSPEIFVYCISNEARECMNQMVNVKNILQNNGVPFIVIGDKEECARFERIAVNTVNLAVVKPFTVASIQGDIMKFMEDWLLHHGERSVKTRKPQTEDLSISEKDVEEKLAELREAFHVEKTKPSVRARNVEGGDLSPVKAAPSKAAPEPAVSASRRAHILVVDDDPLMLKMLKEQLREDYDVATAVNGKIAMKFLERKKTDLILLDYEMPEESGPKVLEKIRANAATKDVPVIFLTGVSDRGKIQEALALKPQSYLLKPVDHEMLRSTITKFVS